jgi:hypothetical protein
MPKSKRFPYILTHLAISADDALPFLPLELSRSINSIKVLADSGATINVLPYQIGLKLGAVWENQTPLSRLSGNLGNFESKGLIVNATIEDFDPIKLAFAWTKAENIPVILGQTNFFSLFDVCFLRQDSEFEIKLRI